MARDFDVFPQTLQQAADGVGRTADRLDASVDSLRSAMERLDGCWGDDEPGRAFEAHYAPQGRAILEQLSELVIALRSVPTGLRKMADRYEQAEASSHIPGHG